MKKLNQYIFEAKENQKWVAIEIITENPFSSTSKESKPSQRVVTVDTYNELKNNGRTKTGSSVISLNKLSPICNSKESAMDYLDNKKTVKKTPIDKKGADYIVYCINSGKLNPSGNTAFDFNLWELGNEDENIYIFGNEYSILFGAKDSLKVGDTVYCVDNDSLRKLPGMPLNEISFVCRATYEDFVKTYRETFPSRCKQPKIAFGKKIDGLPWNKMGQMYSIKGVSE